MVSNVHLTSICSGKVGSCGKILQGEEAGEEQRAGRLPHPPIFIFSAVTVGRGQIITELYLFHKQNLIPVGLYYIQSYFMFK